MKIREGIHESLNGILNQAESGNWADATQQLMHLPFEISQELFNSQLELLSEKDNKLLNKIFFMTIGEIQ